MHHGQSTFRGFSLLELVVVIAIIGIMTSVTLVSFSKVRAGRELEASARELAVVLRTAQNDAVSGRITDSTKVPCSYQVVTSASNTYTLQAFFKASTSGTCSTTPTTVASYTLRGGIVFSGSSHTIPYDIPFGVTVSATKSIAIQSTADATLKTNVCVYQGRKIVDNVSTCP